MSDNDLGVMTRRAREFLTKWGQSPISRLFSGRQITHPEFGPQSLDKTITNWRIFLKSREDRRLEGRKLIVFS